MFDIGFSELMVIAVLALIVLGPERLPKVARTVGHLMGRMQRYVNDVKSDISREMQLEEIKRLESTVQEAARALETTVTSEVSAAENAVRETAASVEQAVSGTPAEPAVPEPSPGTASLPQNDSSPKQAG